MNILNVSQNYFVVGGMDVMMFKTAQILDSHGHNVIPFAAADSLNLPSKYEKYFPVAPRTASSRSKDALRTLYSAKAGEAIGKIIDENAIDIVHIHSYFKRLTSAIIPAIRRRNIPIVQTLHEYRAVCPISTMYRNGGICTDCQGGRYQHAIINKCSDGSILRSSWNAVEMWLSDWVGHKRDISQYMTVSDFQRDLLVVMGMPPEKLVTVHNPVELADDGSGIGSQRHVLFFGRLEDYKGVFIMLDVAERFRDLQFIIAGEGSQEAALRDQIRLRGLTNVDLPGVVKGANLDRMIADSICVVVPSLWPEAFGLTAAESLAHGVPVVAFRSGGLAEIVRDSVDGYLVDKSDIIGIGNRIRSLADDLPRSLEMGAVGKRRMATDFSSEAFYQKLVAVYSTATARQH